jgi:hypothetical protein
MARNSRLVNVRCVLLTLAVASLGVHAAQVVSLRVTSETASPGSIAQIKVDVTEPKPIIIVRGRMSFPGFSDISGIAIGEPDAAAAAVVQGTDVVISIVSPSGTMGLDDDYPILTVAGHVANAPIGTTTPITIDRDTLQLFDLSGAAYLTDMKPGALTTANVLSISSVTPGSADLPAGSVVTITGSNFEPGTRIRFHDVVLAQVRYVSPTRIDVVLAEPARMHGMRIRARNSDGWETTYFSYQRTLRSGNSLHKVLRHVVPVFPLKAMVSASVSLEGVDSGLALQNLDATDTMVFAELLTADGTALASSVIPVPPNHYVVRHVSEIFRRSPSDAFVIRLNAVTPVQVIGIRVDANGRATPRLPQ